MWFQTKPQRAVARVVTLSAHNKAFQDIDCVETEDVYTGGTVSKCAVLGVESSWGTLD